jgi:hypothetical protein
MSSEAIKASGINEFNIMDGIGGNDGLLLLVPIFNENHLIMANLCSLRQKKQDCGEFKKELSINTLKKI